MNKLRWTGLALAASLAVMAGCGEDVSFNSLTPTAGEGGAGGTGTGTNTGTSTGTNTGTNTGTCGVTIPANPAPADGSGDVDFTTVTSLDWDDAAEATGYDVYFSDSCPPPSYPDAAFQSTSDSELTGLTLAAETDYCWQVVALGADCDAQGPVWTFQTACDDPVAGPPLVTSPSLAYPPGTTSDSYALTFSEDVLGVDGSTVVWTAVTGSGTMDAMTEVDPATYTIEFSGVTNGDEYLISVPATVVDECNIPLDAQVDITITIQESGLTCAEAVDVTNAPFPLQLPGDFTDDAPGGSCQQQAFNIVWYEFTPSVTQDYTIWLHNDAPQAWSRVAIFETTDCNPYGAEVLCETAQAASIEVTTELTAGTTYLIMYFEDGDQWAMTDPTIVISYPGPGDECATPIDITNATFPHTEIGTFGFENDDPPPCDLNATVANMVFFEYTAPGSGWYSIDAQNSDPSGTQARLAVYEGTACNPYGTTLACDVVNDSGTTVLVELQQGTTYLIQFTTNLNDQLMVDPVIDIAAIAVNPGEMCAEAIDVSGETFPYVASGTFPYEGQTGGSCDSTEYNMVWFKYTPTQTDWYDVSVQSDDGGADLRLAIFETDACNPYGTELECVTSGSSSATADQVELTSGTTYLILAHTNDDGQAMENPAINITTSVPGWSCDNPAAIGAVNHYTDGNGHDCWSWSMDTSDGSADNDFDPCDNWSGGDVVVEFTTANAQTSLNWDATIANTENGNGYLNVEILETNCASGTSVDCYNAGQGGPQTFADNVTVTPATTYFIWVADGWGNNYLPDVDVCVW